MLSRSRQRPAGTRVRRGTPDAARPPGTPGRGSEQAERVDLDAHRLGALRALRTPAAACSARRARRPGPAAPGPASAPAPPSAGHRPEHLGRRRAAGRRRAGRPPPPAEPVEARHPRRRREAQLAPLGQLPGREPAGVPAQQRLHRGQRAVGDHHHPAAGRRAGPAPPRPASGAAPPRRRAGRPGSAGPRCRAAAPRRSRPRRPARRPGWPPPGRRRRHVGRAPRRGPRCAPARPGNARPSSSAVRRAPVTDGPQPPPAAVRAGVRRRRPGRTTGRPATPLAERSASGPAQCAQRAGVRHSAQATDGR